MWLLPNRVIPIIVFHCHFHIQGIAIFTQFVEFWLLFTKGNDLWQFKWCFAGGPMVARFKWYLDHLSSSTKKKGFQSWTPSVKSFAGSALDLSNAILLVHTGSEGNSRRMWQHYYYTTLPFWKPHFNDFHRVEWAEPIPLALQNFVLVV